MRDILFRGKRKDDGEWVEGFWVNANCYLDDSSVTMIVLPDATLYSHSEISSWEEVIRETVGQFTGLTDKNGNKIFEGDIVKTVEGAFKVVYEHGAFWLYDELLLSNDHLDFLGAYETEVIEVIGNIYDNPELLEE